VGGLYGWSPCATFLWNVSQVNLDFLVEYLFIAGKMWWEEIDMASEHTNMEHYTQVQKLIFYFPKHDPHLPIHRKILCSYKGHKGNLI